MLPAKFGSILPSSFRGEYFFKQQPIRNKNCPWWPYLLVEWNEMEKLYRGPYIAAYCQVWFHLAKLFQRRRVKYEKVNGRTTSDGNTSHGFGPGELKNDEKRTITRWVIRFTSKLQGMQILSSRTCFQFTLNIYLFIVFEIKDEKY